MEENTPEKFGGDDIKSIRTFVFVFELKLKVHKTPQKGRT